MKLVKSFFFVCIVFAINSCSLDGSAVIGPAGGYVFYDKGYYSDGWRYLEASPEVFETKPNSVFIDNYRYGGYDDWYLPSLFEATQMLTLWYKGQDPLVSSEDGWGWEGYWSSTVDHRGDRCWVIAGHGEVNVYSGDDSDYKIYVRLIRKF